MKTCWNKIEQTTLTVHLSFSHAKQLLMKPLFEINSTKRCKSFVGIDASQPYPYSICQPMRTSLYTRWDIDSETSRFTLRQNKTRGFEYLVMSYFQQKRPDCKFGSFHTTYRQKKFDRFSVDGFCSHFNTVFEAMGCFYHFCPGLELRSSLTEEDIERGSEKRELDESRRGYMQENDFTVIEMWEYECWILYKTTANVKLNIRKKFFYRRSLTEQQLLEGAKKRKYICLSSMPF